MRQVLHFVISLRPKQWVKSVFIFAPVTFSLQIFHWPYLRATALAFIYFNLVAGCIYVFNDIFDRERDRAHPQKKERPIASGKLDPLGAAIAGILLLGIALYLAYRLDSLFFTICLVYALLNVLYSMFLKELVIIDIMVIALDFVLRVVAGAAVCRIWLSPWILISTFLLSIFMALIKRRQELLKMGDGEKSGSTRPTLKSYTVSLLDQMISISTATSLIAYIMWVLSPEVQQRLHSHKLYYTVPFVVFAIFRYLFLSYTKDEGESPSDILYTDLPFILNLFLWLLVFLFLVKFNP